MFNIYSISHFLASLGAQENWYCTHIAPQCCDHLADVRTGYLPTSITWPYRGLRFFSYYGQGRQLLLTFLTMVTRWSRSTLIQHLKTCSLWQLKLTEFVSTCDVFNCLFPLDVQNEIQLLSRVFCYSWPVYLLGFWLRNTSLIKVGNPISDGIVFVFHLAWCLRGLKSLKRFLAYLIASGAASRMVSLSNYCVWCLFFISNSMKPSVVHAAI